MRRATNSRSFHPRVEEAGCDPRIGAPAKASTVCNYCRLGPEHLSYITEVNPLRVGRYLPGVHIPIVEEDWMFRDPAPASAAILFAWNYYDEVVPKLRSRGFAGDIICP